MSRARDAAPTLERPYNLKIGPIAFTAAASFGLEYIDNVNLTKEDTTGDIVLTPNLTLTGVWQVSKLNSLEARATFGYTKYLENPNLDSQTALISPDSEIRLNLFVGDVKLIFRESFSIEEDTVTRGGVSGLAKLGRYTNTVGVTALWDLNDVIWSVGVDRYDLITIDDAGNTAGQLNNYSSLNRNVHQLSSAFALKLGPTTRLGIQGAAGLLRYPNNPNADSNFYSLGLSLDMQLTRYTRLTLAAGYQIYTSETEAGSSLPVQSEIEGAGFAVGIPVARNSNRTQGGDGDGFFLSLTLDHRLNRFYSDSLSIDHGIQVGLFGDRSETTRVMYTSRWAISRRLSLNTGIYFSNVQQISQFVGNSFSSVSDYQHYGLSVGTSLQLSKKLFVSLRYQYSQQVTESELQDYAQNRFGLQFGYQF